MIRYLEYHNEAENSHKFWTAHVIEGIPPYANGVKTTFGRVGTMGQVNKKYFDSEEEAIAYLDKKTSQKLAKGYKSDFAIKVFPETF